MDCLLYTSDGIPKDTLAQVLKIVINSIYGKLGFEIGSCAPKTAERIVPHSQDAERDPYGGCPHEWLQNIPSCPAPCIGYQTPWRPRW